MSQSQIIIETLKKALKTQGLKYMDVANHLHMSESSIKRQFTQGDISLSRLEKICDLLDMDIADLMEMVQSQSVHLDQLTMEQETMIVSDIKLMLVTVAVLNHLTFDDIYHTYNFEKAELIRLLFELEKTNLIQLKPDNKIKLLISRSFQWLPNGPIQKYFEEHIQEDFFDCQFTAPGEYRLVVNGMLSSMSNQSVQKKIKQLGTYFNELAQKDRHLQLNRRFGSTLVLALRHWELFEFQQLRRDPEEKVFR